MNICVVSQQVLKTISGVGLHTNNLVRSLLKDGHRVWVIAPEVQRPPGNLPYAFIGVRKSLFTSNQARWIGLSWNYRQVMGDLLNREPVDLVHFTDAREALFYRGKTPAIGNINDTYAAELHSTAYYRKYYDDWLIRWLYYQAVHILEGISFRKLAAVIANSQFTAKIMRDQYRIQPGNLFVCYKSIDPQKYQPALSARKNLPPHPPRVLFVGTNMQRKGLPALIQAAPNILTRLPATEFWVVGEDKVIPKMRLLCKQEGVEPSFRFLGWKPQEELANIYAQCDIFTMPSLTEALGMVFLEAMAAGVAVVGTNVGGIPEIITDGQDGLLVPPDAPGPLANAILSLLEDHSLYERLRAGGLLRAREFDVARMMDSTYQIYCQVLGKKQP